jgi:hypothetical protein
VPVISSYLHHLIEKGNEVFDIFMVILEILLKLGYTGAPSIFMVILEIQLKLGYTGAPSIFMVILEILLKLGYTGAPSIPRTIYLSTDKPFMHQSCAVQEVWDIDELEFDFLFIFLGLRYHCNRPHYPE